MRHGGYSPAAGRAHPGTSSHSLCEEPTIYALVHHTIHDPDRYRATAQDATPNIPPEFKLRAAVPLPGKVYRPTGHAPVDLDADQTRETDLEDVHDAVYVEREPSRN